jgi:hypothetical protein
MFWLLFFCVLIAAGARARFIVPGGRWRDTDGNLVNAHAGGVTKDRETGKFFWFGEYKVQGRVEGGGVSVYSSDDLATWKYHGLALRMYLCFPYRTVFRLISVQGLLRGIHLSRQRTLFKGQRYSTVQRRINTM